MQLKSERFKKLKQIDTIILVECVLRSKRFYTDILGLEILHGIRDLPWQKIFRIYDPDKHIIEIGEPHKK